MGALPSQHPFDVPEYHSHMAKWLGQCCSGMSNITRGFLLLHVPLRYSSAKVNVVARRESQVGVHELWQY